MLTSTVVAQFYIPANSAQGLKFLYFLTYTSYFPFFFFLITVIQVGVK